MARQGRKCLIFGPFETKTSAFCSISRGEAEKHGLGAPFLGPFFRTGSAGRERRLFLISGHVFSSLRASKPGRFFSLKKKIRPRSRGVFHRFRLRFFVLLPASKPGRFFRFRPLLFSFRLRGPSRPETKKKRPQRFQGPLR